MKTWRNGLLALGLGVAMLATGTACQNSLKAQNESLLKQNQILEQRAKTAEEAEARARTDAATAMQAPAATVPSQTETVKAPPEEVAARTPKAAPETFEIAGDATFDLGKATIKPTARVKLNKIAAELKTTYAGHLIRVEGHTDSLPVKTSGWDDNWDLGAARARSVALYLIAQGVPKKDIYIASFADNQPKSKTDVKVNRRVEIVVLR